MDKIDEQCDTLKDEKTPLVIYQDDERMKQRIDMIYFNGYFSNRKKIIDCKLGMWWFKKILRNAWSMLFVVLFLLDV